MARLPDPQVRERWRRRLRQFQEMDVTVAEFCHRQGVSTAAFYQWKRKLAGEQETATERPHFVPVTVTQSDPAPQASESIELSLPGGAVLKLPADTDQQRLADAIRAAVQATTRTSVPEDRSC